MGRYLDIIRRHAGSTKKTNLTKKAHDELFWRLQDLGISIALDKQTGAALLIFDESEAQTVRNVANVYKPFDIQLTDGQRRELTADLEYYESTLRRREC